MQFKKNRSSVFILKYLAVLALIILGSNLYGSHFRYGDISWRVVESDPSGRTIEFKVNTGWRLNVANNIRLNFGDGTSANINNFLTNVNGEYTYATGTVTHTYPSNGNYIAYYYGCCKISNLANNRDDSWYVRSTVNVGNGNNSPVTTMPAIVNLQTGQAAATFNIPATDPDGDNLVFSLANNSQHGWPFGSTHPAGLSINPQNGQVSFNTQGKAIGSLWNTAVAISDGQTTVLVDFIIKITQTSTPPQFDYSQTPANNYVFNASPNQMVNFDITAFDSDPGSSVFISGIGLPSGATISPAFGSTANPISHSFNWTPAANQFGTYVMNFIAQDNNGVQSQTSVSIIVSLKPQFDSPPTPLAGNHLVVSPGDTISYPVQASDPDSSDVVSIINAEGKDAGGNKIPLYSGASLSPFPTAAGNPSSGSFNWITQAADWGHRHVFFTAQDSYGDKRVHEVSQLINTPPYFSSAPLTTALVNQPYSYTVTVVDPDTAFGDQISIHGIGLPAWLSLSDNGDGTATLSGTPGPLHTGLKNIHLQAEDLLHHDDPRAIVDQNFSLDVRNCFVNLSVKTDTLSLDPSGQAILQPNDVLAYGYAVCGPLSYSVTPNTFSCGDIGSHNVVLTATDAMGNIASATTVVYIEDNTAPVVSSKNLSLSLNPNGSLSIQAADLYNGASDACGIDSMWISKNSFSCADVGINEVVLKVIDHHGNTGSDTAQIHLQDQSAPNVLTRDISILLDASGQAYISPAQIDSGSNDACGIDSMWVSPASFGCQQLGANQVMLSVLDIHGNLATGAAQVTVADLSPPTVLTNNLSVALDSSGQASIKVSQVDNGSNDACGIDSLALSHSDFDCNSLGITQILLNAWDLNGNHGAEYAQLEVVDQIMPSIQCPANISITAQPDDCEPQVYWPAPTAWDNCSYTISSSHQAGDRFSAGQTTVFYQITDAAGNSSSDSFTVTVNPLPLSLSLTAATFNGGWNVSCHAALDGSIQSFANGGCEPYSYSWSNGSAGQNLNGIGAGSYILTLSDAKGRSISDSIVLNEPAALQSSISGAPVFTTTAGVDSFTVYLGYGLQTITLEATANGGTPGYSYQWLPTPGLSSYSTANTQATPQVPSNYVCKVTDLNGCESLDSFYVDVVEARCGNSMNKVLLCHKGNEICVNPNAVRSHLQHGDKLGPCSSNNSKSDLQSVSARELKYSLYPNPTTGHTRLSFDDAEANWQQVLISDISGKSILVIKRHERPAKRDLQLDLSHFSSGIYLLQIISPSKVYCEKIILE